MTVELVVVLLADSVLEHRLVHVLEAAFRRVSHRHGRDPAPVWNVVEREEQGEGPPPVASLWSRPTHIAMHEDGLYTNARPTALQLPVHTRVLDVWECV